MSGQAGGRGYLVQSLICVLELARNKVDWETVTLEPDLDEEKVDIMFTGPVGSTVIQVKSSQNQINLPDVLRWATTLEQSIAADRYELRLIGPCSASVSNIGQHGRVQVPTPHALNIHSLIEQAAHQLDAYFDSRGFSHVPAFVRELLVSALVTKLSTFATCGQPITRSDLEKLLSDWVLELYPRSIHAAIEEQLYVSCDNIVILPSGTADLTSTMIVAPVVFRNDGVRTVVVEDLAITINRGSLRARLKAACEVSLADLRKEGHMSLSSMQDFFMAFPLAPRETLRKDIVFVPQHESGQDSLFRGFAGEYEFILHALIQGRDDPVALATRLLDLKVDCRAALLSTVNHIVLRFRRREFNL